MNKYWINSEDKESLFEQEAIAIEEKYLKSGILNELNSRCKIETQITNYCNLFIDYLMTLPAFYGYSFSWLDDDLYIHMDTDYITNLCKRPDMSVDTIKEAFNYTRVLESYNMTQALRCAFKHKNLKVIDYLLEEADIDELQSIQMSWVNYDLFLLIQNKIKEIES